MISMGFIKVFTQICENGDIFATAKLVRATSQHVKLEVRTPKIYAVVPLTQLSAHNYDLSQI